MIVMVSIAVIWFFFFQAEDGIRDLYVTGVQTCALPILLQSTELNEDALLISIASAVTTQSIEAVLGRRLAVVRAMPNTRSEERRVGKECRYRGLFHHLKKNTKSIDKMTLQAAYDMLHRE